MITFQQFVESYKDVVIAPKEETLKTYEWVVDKELMPKSVLDYFKRPIMYSYDNKSHDIKKVKSLTYYSSDKVIYATVILDNDKEVVLKVFHAFGATQSVEAKPNQGSVKHDSEFNPSELENKFASEEGRKRHGMSPRDFYN